MMNYGFVDFLRLLGSLAVFLFGMKLMSESLQKVAGNKLRAILASMTANRMRGVLTGILITTLIQSSSATIVMIVSFVNAGLLSLLESISVVMGANIGTTVTAWIISLFGFKFNITQIALPMVGLALPVLFSRVRSRKSWGELVMGFGLLFIGLEFLKTSVPDVSSNPEVLGWLSQYAHMGYLGYILFMLIGTLLTILIQSSSATMALTLVMCNNGWINFDMAAAMVLGENLGTTITANVAALVANTNARRAARAHLFFNLAGVVWMLIIFPFFLKGVAFLTEDLGGGNPFESSNAIPVALALFHTLFNVLNMLLLIGFTKTLARIVTRLVPERKAEAESAFTLQHIKIGLLSTPEASLYLAREEISLFGQRVSKMFKDVQELMTEIPDKRFELRFQRLESEEKICDGIEIEIANYLTKVGETRLSVRNSRVLSSMFKLIDNIESIGDSCYNIGRAFNRAHEQQITFSGKPLENLEILFSLVDDTIQIMEFNLKTEDRVDASVARKKEEEINVFRDILKTEHLENLEKGMYNYQKGSIYNDIFNECERLADYAINVSESLESVSANL